MTESDEMDVHALADNQLSPTEKKRVQARMEKDPAMQRKYCQIVTQKQLLLEWWHSLQGRKPAKEDHKKEREKVDATH